MDRQQGRQILINLDDINLDDLRRTIEATVDNAVNSAVSRALKRTTSNSGPPGHPRPSKLPGEPGITTANYGTSNPSIFRARDVDYFDPNSEAEPVEVTENYRIYHNIFSFTNRLQECVVIMDPTVLRDNVPNCLIGKAKRWYTEELSNITRLGLQNSSINDWCDLLKQRFRDPPAKSQTALEMEQYTIQDVRRRRDPADYIQSIVLLGQNAGTATTDATQV